MPYKDPAKMREARARYRERHPERVKEQRRYWNRRHPARVTGTPKAKRLVRNHPFVGVDGEGGGKDALGRQHYLVLRAGEKVLFKDNEPLTTADCLDFLAKLDPDFQYVSYFFNYDVTMILRDLNEERIKRILTIHDEKYASGNYHFNTGTIYKRWEVEWMAGRVLKVRRHVPWPEPGTKRPRWVEIHDVGSFFQCPFVEALENWAIGTKRERARIAAGKKRRGKTRKITEREIAYNAAEVRCLEALMEAFRGVCKDADVVPQRWEGPGGIAVALFKKHGVPTRKQTPVPDEVNRFAIQGYYGGRFEVPRFGLIEGAWEHDINSAYVESLLHLPCLLHGRWERKKPTRRQPRPETLIYIADVRYRHAPGSVLCHLPHRQPTGGLLATAIGRASEGGAGSICWPVEGGGVYWADELRAAERAGTKITRWTSWYEYHRTCDCRPFEYVREAYRLRLELGKLRGTPIKLGLNSQYGKTAQAIGSAPYGQPIWAGLITAHTRAALIEAYSRIAAEDVVMLATDGLYTRVPIPGLSEGDGLGEWKIEQLGGLFTIQPGLYFVERLDGTAGKAKTRGIPRGEFAKYEADARAAWAAFLPQLATGARMTDGRQLKPPDVRFPEVEAKINNFIGLRLAYARGKLETSGKWVEAPKRLSFDWTNKRSNAYRIDGSSVLTSPPLGGRDITSAPYSRPIGALRDMLLLRDLEFEAMPDFLELVEERRE